MARKDRISLAGNFRFVIIGLLLQLLTTTGVALAHNPVPLVNEPLVPDTRIPGAAGFMLTVNGTGFVSGATVNWNGSPLATTFVSGSRLTASVLASDVANAGTASVTVVNPSPGGGTSNVAFFPVTVPTSTIGLNTPTEYATGSGPTSVATADFNGDGKLDLAVSNSGSNNVSVLLGNGDGTFQAAVNYDVGTNPTGIAVGDFKRDGKLDLAVSNSGSNNVSVLLGNEDGTFQAAVNYDVGTNPTGIAVGDFNGDGKLDLVVSNQGDSAGTVSVLIGNGDGTFQPAVDYAAGSQPNSVTVGDFNGDGKLDLAVANEDSFTASTVSILLGKGDGKFEPPVSYTFGVNDLTIATADFNGDGNLDLAVVDSMGSAVWILRGNGDGTFQAPVSYATDSFPVGLGIADFTGDGKLDLAVGSSGSNTLQVFLGNGNGTFQSPLQFVGGLSPQGLAVGDFDESGRLDVAITDKSADAVSILLQAIFSPTRLRFATQVVGATSTAQSVTVVNYGTVALAITKIAIIGADQADFHQTNTCGSSVAPGASCTVSITFKPTQTGQRTARLFVTDNAPGSPKAVSLIGTGTDVELKPASLEFGVVPISQSRNLAAMLTNVGSTALGIAGIKVTGTNSDDLAFFSQTNNCGLSVGAGKSCTITVTFKPAGIAKYSANVSISDNGGGSPQTVSLSGSGCLRWKGKCKTALTPAMQSTLAASHSAAAPAPTGSSKVGTRILDWVDSGRDDPFLANGSKRELLVRFWYPASIDKGCKPADYTSAGVWNYFSDLTKLPLPQVKTNSCLNTPVATGAHPVVVFTHGYTGTFTDYTFLFEDLASRGYVVVSIDHTYEATAVEFPDGRFVQSMVGSHLANTWHTDDQTLSFALSVRLGDLTFVLNELEGLNASPESPFIGKLDMTRVALAGHSLGGLTTWFGLQQDARFKAGILLDPYLADIPLGQTDTPVVLLTMGNNQQSEDECQLWSDLLGPRFFVNLHGSEHLTPTDAVWLAKGAIKTGTMGPEKTIAAVRDYVAAFLDANLRGEPADLLLTGPSSNYPDSVVTTRNESFCSGSRGN